MDQFLKKIIKEGGKLSKKMFYDGVNKHEKSHSQDIVTEGDIAVSEFLVAAIQKEFPDHGIHSEELKEEINPGAEYRWVIDPIDGTRNYGNAIPLWCGIIGIEKNGEAYMGAVYSPTLDQLFFAEKGKGAFLNDQQIHAGGRSDLNEAVGFARAFSGRGGVYGQECDRYRKLVSRLVLETDAILMGFGNMDMPCRVAAGQADYFIHNAGLDHDYVAPVLIMREAGVKVTDSDGNEWTKERQDVIAANPALHEKIMAYVD